jgi:hypothetical protein
MLRIARRNPTSPRKRGEVTQTLTSISTKTITLWQAQDDTNSSRQPACTALTMPQFLAADA